MAHLDSSETPFIDRLRELISDRCPEAQETGRAEADLTALSFQSTTLRNRHVWVNIFLDRNWPIVIDLEDWDSNANWDNSVAHFEALTVEGAAGVCVAWLSG